MSAHAVHDSKKTEIGVRDVAVFVPLAHATGIGPGSESQLHGIENTSAAGQEEGRRVNARPT